MTTRTMKEQAEQAVYHAYVAARELQQSPAMNLISGQKLLATVLDGLHAARKFIFGLDALLAPEAPPAETPTHIHQFAQFEICRVCGRTEADIVSECHHCTDNDSVKNGRCWWCLRPVSPRDERTTPDGDTRSGDASTAAATGGSASAERSDEQSRTVRAPRAVVERSGDHDSSSSPLTSPSALEALLEEADRWPSDRYLLVPGHVMDRCRSALRALLAERDNLMAERPVVEPLKLNLYGRACYRAGQQSVAAERATPEAEAFTAGWFADPKAGPAGAWVFDVERSSIPGTGIAEALAAYRQQKGRGK